MKWEVSETSKYLWKSIKKGFPSKQQSSGRERERERELEFLFSLFRFCVHLMIPFFFLRTWWRRSWTVSHGLEAHEEEAKKAQCNKQPRCEAHWHWVGEVFFFVFFLNAKSWPPVCFPFFPGDLRFIFHNNFIFNNSGLELIFPNNK